MKVTSKSFAIDKQKVEQIMSEKEILTKVNNPFIVNLHYAFQSVFNIFVYYLIETLSFPCCRYLSWRGAFLSFKKEG